MDWTFKPDPNEKGSYRRRIEDIDRALTILEIDRLPEPSKFVTYFFGCEKLAHGMVGIESGLPAHQAYLPSSKIRLTALKSAASTLGVTFPVDEFQYLFADQKDPP